MAVPRGGVTLPENHALTRDPSVQCAIFKALPADPELLTKCGGPLSL
jgi:hypothetical protein